MTKHNARKAKSLRPDPHNARLHNERNQAMIRQSLEEIGPFRSIGVDGSNIIRAGNGVFEQAQALGLKVRVIDAKPDELIAVRRADLKGKRAERAALFDNRSSDLSEWDADVIAQLAEDERALLEGMFDDRELREIIREANGGQSDADAEPQFDKATELQKKWGVKLGDLWRIGEHRLICGDCTDRAVVERVMRGEKADYLVTDPPYVLQAASDKAAKADQDDQALRHFLRSAWIAVLPFMQSCAGAAWFCNWRTIDCVRTATRTRNEKNYQPAVWYKGKGAIPGTPWMNTWEMLLFYAVGTFNSQQGATGLDNFIEIAWGGRKREMHPAEKPVAVYEYAMTPMIAGQIVVDPFLGSGTALIACERLGRKCRAIEINPAYCAVALQRMADAFPGIEIERVEAGQRIASQSGLADKRNGKAKNGRGGQ